MVLEISNEQFQAFALPARAEWVAGAAQRLHQTYPEYFTALGVEALVLRPLCQAVEQWAAEHGIRGQRDVSRLCCVASTLGHKFWRDPRFDGYVKGSVENAEFCRKDAVDILVDNTSDWLAILWYQDTLTDFTHRLDGCLRRDAEPTAETLVHILPGHWVLFDADTNARLMAWLIRSLPPTHQPSQRLAYVACALVHGTAWLRDPQYGRLLQAIEGADTTAHLADDLSAIYAEIG